MTFIEALRATADPKRPHIIKAYTRLYGDNGQLTAYVEWSDGSRTEGPATKPRVPAGRHMAALFTRAECLGLRITHEVVKP